MAAVLHPLRSCSSVFSCSIRSESSLHHPTLTHPGYFRLLTRIWGMIAWIWKPFSSPSTAGAAHTKKFTRLHRSTYTHTHAHTHTPTNTHSTPYYAHAPLRHPESGHSAGQHASIPPSLSIAAACPDLSWKRNLNKVGHFLNWEGILRSSNGRC